MADSKRTFCLLIAGAIAAAAQNPAVTVNVDVNANRHGINPYIYGTNYATTTTLNDLNAPLHRMGGNNTTRYNWQANADNRDADWYFESIGDTSAVAGERGDTFISSSKAAGAQPMLTIPMIDWIAKLGPNRSKLASFSVSKYGAQTSTDPWMPDAGNGVRSGGGYVTGNDPNDANTPSNSAVQKAWVQYLVNKWGAASNGGLKYYLLDNEHSIWWSTHRDVRPTGSHATEIRDRILDFSAMVKSVDPSALVAGPEEWGWGGFQLSGYDQQYGSLYGWSYLPDRATVMNNQDYLPWMLAQFKAAGAKPLDIVSVHWYPQGAEFSNDVSTTTQLLRNQSTRSLWDPNYVDQSWIGTQVKLIPRLRAWVDTNYYAGTPIAITEYNWGAESHINGATTQADIFGIFGREGLDMATRWTTPDASTPTYKAIKMYRNYDGNKSTFGDVSVSAVAPNPDSLAVFAASRTLDGALTVMVISKVLSGATPVTLNLANFVGIGTAQAWQLTSSNSITRLTDVSYTGGTLSANVPAQSITLLVLPVSTHPAPTASFSATPTTGAAPLPVAFDASASTASGATLSSYAWQFGDGATGTGVAVNHTYPAAGAYVVTLKVTDSLGAVGSATKTITVSAPPPAVGCSVKYAVTNDWKTGFTGDVVITNTGTASITNWTLVWSFSGNQKITAYWNGTAVQSGKKVQFSNAAWNATIAAGGTAQIGFNANYSGKNTAPTSFTLNGVACK